MALSEVQRSRLELRRVEAVGGEDTVRHIDQLSEAELRAFLQLSNNGALTDAPLRTGEIIVASEYYRIEQA